VQKYSININFKAIFCKKYVFLHDNNFLKRIKQQSDKWLFWV